MFLCLIGVTGCSEQGEPYAKVPINKQQFVQLSVPNFQLQKKTVKKNSYFTLVKDTSYEFAIVHKRETVGKLSVTTRHLDNGDVFLFTKLQNDTKEPLNAEVSIHLKEVNRYHLIDWDQRFKKQEHHKTTGVDETTYPMGLVKAFSYDKEKYDLVLSKNYLSRELVKKYEDDRKSIVRELIKEEKAFSANVKGDSLSFVLPLQSTGNDISENWMLFSKEKLFKNDQHLQQWINEQIDNYKRANSWLTAEGPYTKLPWSIEPGTKKGYGRNLGIMQDQMSLDYFEQYKDRYFYDLVLNSAANLLAYKQTKGTKLWETEYTSTWLKKAYGTTAPYMDTRHNEYIALFLTKVGKLLNIDELTKAETIYGDYLVQQVKIGNIIQVKEGYLIADYFSPYNQSKKTHTSMNHILGGVNILLHCYMSTGDKKYLDVALNIRKGIEELGDQWIRDSGDLWYQVNPDLTFTGNDYEQLTLIDLLMTQENFEKAGIHRSKALDKLIRSKAGYLVREKKQLYPYVIEMLTSQGFKDVLLQK
jgi:hypothetical protein